MFFKFFRNRQKKELTLEQEIFLALLRRGPLDGSQISIEVLEFDESKLKEALSSLVELEYIEPKNEQSEEKNFFLVVWKIATSLRKKTREQRKQHARRILGAAQA